MRKQAGPYRIDGILGRGGMGVVYRGMHERLDRQLAIKALAPDLTWQPEFRDRFFAEARTQGRLQHPNILAVYDLLEDAGEYFIVMEYVAGSPLDVVLREAAGRGIAVSRALAIISQVLLALDYAHSQAVIHRDVKPSNVLVTADDRVKLTDFGIALLVGDKRLTASRASIGTPIYMAPEQILRPRQMDHRADIYSAAIVLYEMLAGAPPFDAETEFEIKKLQIEAPPPDLRQRRHEIPSSISEAIRRALAKDPEARFASARGFLRALEAAAPGSLLSPEAAAGPSDEDAGASPLAPKHTLPPVVQHPPAPRGSPALTAAGETARAGAGTVAAETARAGAGTVAASETARAGAHAHARVIRVRGAIPARIGPWRALAASAGLLALLGLAFLLGRAALTTGPARSAQPQAATLPATAHPDGDARPAGAGGDAISATGARSAAFASAPAPAPQTSAPLDPGNPRTDRAGGTGAGEAAADEALRLRKALRTGITQVERAVASNHLDSAGRRVAELLARAARHPSGLAPEIETLHRLDKEIREALLSAKAAPDKEATAARVPVPEGKEDRPNAPPVPSPPAPSREPISSSPGYVLEIQDLALEPATVRPGDTVTVKARFLVHGPNPQENIGVWLLFGLSTQGRFILSKQSSFVLFRGGADLGAKSLVSTCRMTIPQTLPPVAYEISVTIADDQGRFRKSRSHSFEVVRATTPLDSYGKRPLP